jgi:phosphoglycerate kinase
LSSKHLASHEGKLAHRHPHHPDLAKDGGLQGKRVFIRVDFNVPLDKKTGEITDDARIREALPTIQFAMEAGAKVILASHMGRPQARQTRGPVLEVCGARLAELTGVEVHLPDDCIGDAAKKVIFDLRAGQLCLLENLRFHEEEEKNDESFARQLAELCDVYVTTPSARAPRPRIGARAAPDDAREGGGLPAGARARRCRGCSTNPRSPTWRSSAAPR